jgi:hypothetical protein
MKLIFTPARNGGGIFHGMCNVVQKLRSRCFWVGMSMSPEATIVLLQNNLAHGNFYWMLLPSYTFCPSYGPYGEIFMLVYS